MDSVRWLLRPAAPAAIVAFAGCNLISGLSGIEANPEGGVQSSGGLGGSGGSPVTSSTTSATGAGGQGGESEGGGGSGGCGSPSECPDASPDDCIVPTCENQVCSTTFAAADTPCSEGGGIKCDDAGNCLTAGCSNAMQEDEETDVDCGGSSCPPCKEGKGCEAASDCETLLCDTGTPHQNGASGSCAKCTLDNQCATGEFCNTDLGKCTKKVVNGGGCSKPSACQSGFCADGFCCDAACTGGCESCSQNNLEGSCTPLGQGVIDPSCNNFLCLANDGDCPTTCDDNGDCIDGGFCRQSTMTCFAKKLAVGATCEGDPECTTGYCCSQKCSAMACP